MVCAYTRLRCNPSLDDELVLPRARSCRRRCRAVMSNKGSSCFPSSRSGGTRVCDGSVLDSSLILRSSPAHTPFPTRQLALIKLPALAAGPQTDSAASQEALLLSRTVFERSIVLAVQAGDLGAFQRAWAQLEPFYTDAALVERLPPSSERASLSALNLLRLLTISAPAEFHCKLELLPDEVRSW